MSRRDRRLPPSHRPMGEPLPVDGPSGDIEEVEHVETPAAPAEEAAPALPARVAALDPAVCGSYVGPSAGHCALDPSRCLYPLTFRMHGA